MLADIDKLANPDEAPHTIRFTAAMTAMVRSLYQRSYPATHAREQGGTIVADHAGRLSIQNVGGLGGTAGSFTPNVMLKDPLAFRVVGIVHTHPYDRTEGSMTGVAFSGGDVGQLILTDTILSVVQSGPRLFVYLKTALAMRVKAGQTFQQASRIIARGRGLQYGLTYYQGANGVATRV